MDASEKQYFELMKTRIVTVMQQANSGIPVNIADWKGNDIFLFQEDIRAKAGAYFSEKWFYNHFKTRNAKIPRIDLLNILSRYVGYQDWAEFKNKNTEDVPNLKQFKGSNRIFYLLPGMAAVVFFLVWVLIKQGSYATYTFCFVNHDSDQPIRSGHIRVDVLSDDESPMQITCDAEGCFTYRTNKQEIRFLVTAPYYYPDTVRRILRKEARSEKIPLRINDYALMLYYYSNSKIQDWEKRRSQLDRIIADSAYICQVLGKEDLGVELYNKQEFIDLLTTPAASLQHLEILEIFFTHEQISTIRFIRN